MGGFPPVRSRACNLESGHSVYGVAGPEAERQLADDQKRQRMFNGFGRRA